MSHLDSHPVLMGPARSSWGQQGWITGRKGEEMRQVRAHCLTSPTGEPVPLPPLGVRTLKRHWGGGEEDLFMNPELVQIVCQVRGL